MRVCWARKLPHASRIAAPNPKETAVLTKDELASIPLLQALTELESSARGLTSAQARSRLQRYGPNEIAEQHRNPILVFLGYFWAPIPWMIEAALILSKASFRDVIAVNTVFNEATLEDTVLTGADCQYADFRKAKLSGCKLSGAKIGYARFAGAQSIPEEVKELLHNMVGRPGAEVP